MKDLLTFLKNVSPILFGIGLALFASLIFIDNSLLADAGVIVILLGWVTASVHSALLDLRIKIDTLK